MEIRVTRPIGRSHIQLLSTHLGQFFMWIVLILIHGFFVPLLQVNLAVGALIVVTLTRRSKSVTRDSPSDDKEEQKQKKTLAPTRTDAQGATATSCARSLEPSPLHPTGARFEFESRSVGWMATHAPPRWRRLIVAETRRVQKIFFRVDRFFPNARASTRAGVRCRRCRCKCLLQSRGRVSRTVGR